MPRFSEAFGLNKTQPELDFVDVALDEDLPLFIDPFALSQSPERWSQDCHTTLHAYFQEIVDLIRTKEKDKALGLMRQLGEPNETRLGLSRAAPRGAGIGFGQAESLYEALAQSRAVATGFITSLEECELMVEGIGRDKISDLTTNVVRHHLAEYTKSQCDLHGISTRGVALPAGFDASQRRWTANMQSVPVWNDSPILLVPKSAVRRDPAYDHNRYYRHFVLDYLEAEELTAHGPLVRTLQNGRQRVLRKDLEAKYPLSKRFLFEFSREHPEVLQEYRDALAEAARSGFEGVEPERETQIAEGLAQALRAIPGGGEDAGRYHNLMIGIVEFLFFPNLLHPIKEAEIHQGRKRIDIRTENGAASGIFFRLHDVRKVPCPYIVFECKNYTGEIGNPELDQLSGRFSLHRGQVGFLCCRKFDDRAKFIERCRDTHRDGRGLILPVDDAWVKKALAAVEAGRRPEVDELVSQLVTEVWFS